MSKQLKKNGKKPSSVPFPNKILDPTMTRPEALHTYFIRNCSSMMNHRRLLNSNSICCAKDWKLCFSKCSSTYWEKMTIKFVHCCLFQHVTLQSQVIEGSCNVLLASQHPQLQRGHKGGSKNCKIAWKNTKIPHITHRNVLKNYRLRQKFLQNHTKNNAILHHCKPLCPPSL